MNGENYKMIDQERCPHSRIIGDSMHFAFETFNYKVSEDERWKTYTLDGDQKFHDLNDALAMLHNKDFGIWNRLVAANNVPGVNVEYEVLRLYGPHSAPRYNLKKATFTVGTEADQLMNEIMTICFTKFGLSNVKVCPSETSLYVVVDRKNVLPLNLGDSVTFTFDEKGNYQSVIITRITKGLWNKPKKISKVFTKVRG